MAKRPLRVLHIATERSWRGGEQQVQFLIEGLAAQGVDNRLAARPDGALAERVGGRVPIVPVRPLLEWDPIVAHRLNRYVRAQRIDVVHAHTGHGVAIAAFATLGTRVPFVVTRRVDFPIGRNWFSRLKYRRAARVIAISTGVRSVLLADGVPAEKIVIVPSGIDFRRYANVPERSREELGLPEGEIVGQIAALAPHKDQDTFVDAMARLHARRPAVRGVIVGDGPSRREVEAAIRKRKMKGIVVLVGQRREPLPYLRHFRVFCLSSSTEGLGTSLIDAMAMRVPIVATKVGGVPDLIEDGVTGRLVPAADGESLAAALQWTLAAPDGNQALVAAAVEKARQFDVVHTVIRTRAVYDEVRRSGVSR